MINIKGLWGDGNVPDNFKGKAYALDNFNALTRRIIQRSKALNNYLKNVVRRGVNKAFMPDGSITHSIYFDNILKEQCSLFG